MHASRRSLLCRFAATLAPSPVWVGASHAQSIENSGDPERRRAAHVLNRLALGARPGELARVAQAGVDRWVDEQLNPESLPMPAALTQRLASLRTIWAPPGQLVVEYRGFVRERLAQAANPAPRTMEGAPRSPAAAEVEAPGSRANVAREALTDALEARLLRALDSPRQLEEVMVDFWFNHFNVFIGKNLDRVLVGHYEQHAIRPHAMGRFRDLLGATAKHPAMLFYLDNAQSVAPGFAERRPAAAAGPRPTGLNENYARELMELHTLGAQGGYTQADVTELARMLTGWTFDPRAGGQDIFRFEPLRHDQGTKHWLGRTVTADGQAEAEAALDVLARHPATARRIGYKLAQAFVTDEPPPALVQALADSFLREDGQIRPVLRTLFERAEFRSPEAFGAKFKTPYRYVLSVARAAGLSMPVSVTPLAGAMNRLGMPLYGCQTPDGYADHESVWLNPAALTRRIDFATAMAAGRLAFDREPPSPGAVAANGDAQPGPLAAGNAAERAVREPLDWQQLERTLGEAIGPRTRSVVASSAPPLRAAMLLGSPDFMKR